SYSSVLAFAVLFPRWTSLAQTHLTLIMLGVVGAYISRDIYPLATYTLKPMDEAQGWLLWSRIVFASFVGVVIPLNMPRTYTPVDPLNPAKEVNTEQTASWWSFLTYTYLDPLILLAARSVHLDYESLPPLADYDRAEYLVDRSKPVLDPYVHGKRSHIFWGIMRLYALEYTQLASMITLRCLVGFFPPIAMNRLLDYLETGGKDAKYRPWVWIVATFVGPNIGVIALQNYIFVATRMMVRTEGIITQLVFDHALKIRLKEEISPKAGQPSTAINTPETRSTVDGDITELESETENSSDSGEETLHGTSNVSRTSSTPTLKGKQKANETNSSPPATPGPPPTQEKTNNLVGKINNFVTTDLGNVVDGRDFLWPLLYSPLQFGICVYLLYSILDGSAIVGVGVSAAAIPLPAYIAKKLNQLQKERMQKTDSRVQTVTEILSVIRMTKLFGWEEKMYKRISEKREDELRTIRKRKLMNLVNINMNFLLPLFTMLVTFGIYTIVQKNILTASVVFSSMAVFEQLRESMRRAFFMLPYLIDGKSKVSLSRINDFLLNTELLDRFATRNEAGEHINDAVSTIEADTIGFWNASFSWTGSQEALSSFGRQYRLTIDGELFFKRGRLNLIIGPTGCGKTSLLMALLGEMHFQGIGENAGFNLPRAGGVSYAAQEAWVQNDTIKNNILFGKGYDEERYKKVIYQCGLERDLNLFEAGDDTEVGEKGLTLSGGQKARVTLARAVYSDARIVLLDDILAALDVHTSKFIVDNCLQGDLLQGRTVILVTHNVAMVKSLAAFVVSIGLDGHIVSQGSMTDALAVDDTLLNEAVESQELELEAKKSVDVDPPKKNSKSGSKLVVAEEIAMGHVSWQAIRLYLSSLGGIGFWTSFILAMLVGETANALQSWYLGHWAAQYNDRPPWAVPVGYHLSMYGLILFSISAFWTVSMVIYVIGAIKASRTIHEKLITGVLGTTLRWLDTVPTARVIARCTQDIRSVDGPVADTLCETIQLSFSLLLRFGAVIFFVPIFVFPGIAVFIAGSVCGQLYIKAQLSVKREMSNRRSPVLAHFGAAISGLISIRAYSAQEAFKQESLKRINGYTRAARTFYNCNRWVCIRIEAIGAAFTAGLAAYLAYGHSGRTASETGFSLVMAISFSGGILWWIRILNEFEVQGNSLERIESYTNIAQEPKATQEGKPPAYWPASGAIRVENLCARYSDDGPEVLHDISFEIKSGERIGVVGRTGSGKSSLTLSLLRCIPTDGKMYFDGLTTDSINLNALRSGITIIPQIPELLSGTLRENLDPFSEHSDAVLNEALRAAGLFNLQVEGDESKITLDSPISGGGGNLSVGQRQILALARAILRRSKLLILDEATSAIDYATDSIIQNTLREVLKDATLITIAHRLQTIMDADKIMVLDAGNMVEFDSPRNLLKKDGGYLKGLVDESGDPEALYRMAEDGRTDT
ncbi:P-loop containing nucleoside triphosphate hydrolase protein, partial [Hysterangium stoloniferum]